MERSTGLEHSGGFLTDRPLFRRTSRPFHFEYPRDAPLLIRSDKVDLDFSAAVPPGTEFRIQTALPNLRPEPPDLRPNGIVRPTLAKVPLDFLPLMRAHEVEPCRRESVPKGEIRIDEVVAGLAVAHVNHGVDPLHEAVEPLQPIQIPARLHFGETLLEFLALRDAFGHQSHQQGVVRRVHSQFIREHEERFGHEEGAVTEEGLDHRRKVGRAGVEQFFDVARNASRDRVEEQQILGLRTRVRLSQKTLKHGRAKRSQLQKTVVPLVERLVVVFKDFADRGLDRPAHEKKDSGLVFLRILLDRIREGKVAIPVDTTKFTEEEQDRFIDGWTDAGGNTDDAEAENPWFAPWEWSPEIFVRGTTPEEWGADFYRQCKPEIDATLAADDGE